MIKKISEDIIESIRSSLEIVDVISEFVTLKKRGHNFVGLCPFHNERDPSFNVVPEKQMFYCFGCGKGGDVFKFIMEIENLSYMEAIRYFASKFNIRIEEDYEDSDKTLIYKITYRAADIYFENLQKSFESAQYLKRRGISWEMVKKFKIGYAPGEWNFITNWFIGQGISPELLIKSGLTIDKKEKKYYYDRFRNRIIFPVFNSGGVIVGFGGRAMGEDDVKYINSPETLIYQKGKNLYGLFQAKEFIRKEKEVFIVEGYIDCITLHQAGFCNVVAPLGTALTSFQVKVISQYVKKAILVFDADVAGMNAIDRAIGLLLSSNIEVKVLLLPEGEDPDSFIKKFGGDAFFKLKENSKDFLDYEISRFGKDIGMANPFERSRMFEPILENIWKIPDSLTRERYLKLAAQKLEVDPLFLTQKGKNAFRKHIFESQSVDNKKQGIQITLEEEALLKCIMSDSRYAEFVFTEISPDLLMNQEVKELFLFLKSTFCEKGKIDMWHALDRIDREKWESILISAVSQTYEEDVMDKFVKDTVKTLKDQALKQRLKSIKMEMKEKPVQLQKSLLKEYYEFLQKQESAGKEKL